ncbi:MAG: ABC transporter permease [Bacilli bacterium]|nr:ABC transporter permease [Bacilli bacterium]MDY6430358.1 ABC transporter permease [Bacilli bacterium]
MKSSTKYIIERILFIFLTAFIILSVTYILCQLLPIEIIGQKPQELVAFWDKQCELGYYYHVDEAIARTNPGSYTQQVTLGSQTFYYAPYSVMHRYFVWLGNIFTKWDWGESTKVLVGHQAIDIIMEHLPYSMRLNIISILISVPAGIGLGVLAALKKNTWVDSVISTVIMVFISVPSFVMISFLLIWFGYSSRILPTSWPTDAQAVADPVYAIKAYIIPVSALCFGSIAGFTRYTRAELTEVMSSEFLLLARTKGLTKAQSVVRHALRNSMVPIIPMIIGEFIGILSGSMVLEQLYGIPGVGYIFVTALNGKDWSVVMVDMAIYTLIGLAATLIIDLSYGFVDPRIRMGAKK